MKIGRKESRGIASVRLASQAIADLKYKSLFENSGTAIVIIDKDGIYHLVNSRAAKHFGGDVDDIVGKSIFDFLPQEGAQKYLERNQKVIESGIGEEYEYTFELPTGTKTLLITDQVLIDGRGIGYALQSSGIDITARKQAEEALKESESNYRLLARNLPDTSIFLFDHNLRFILAEGHLSSEFGFTISDIEGKTLRELLPPERANRLAPIYMNALEGRSTENLISEFNGRSYSVNILPVKNNRDEIIAGMVVSQDITTRRQADEALNANYSLLRIAGETAKFGGWSVDAASNKVIWSDTVAKIHEMPIGYNPSIDEGISFYAPEWRDKITQLFTNCSENGTPYDEEMEIITAKGKRVWIRTTEEAFVDDKGKIVKIQGAFQDISERKLADQALHESEEKWRKLVNTIPDYIALYDRDGKYLFLNHFAEGFSVKDIEGKTYIDFLQDDSKPIYEQAFNIAKQTNSTQYVEHTALGDNRSIRHYESFFVPIFEHDEFVNMMVIARDITERKQIENELAKEKALIDAIFNSIPGIIYLYDLEGNLVRWNTKHEIMTGYTGEELSHKKLLDWYKGDIDSQIAVNDGVKATILNGFGTAEANLQKKDGKTIPMYFTASLLTINGKEYFTGVGIDITKRKQAEAAVLKSKKQYDNLVSKIPVGVYILKTKPDGTFALEYVSPRMAEMLGLSVEDLLSDNHAIFTAIHSDDLESFTRLNREGIEQKRPFNWKGRVVVKGDIRWFHISSLPEQLDNGDMLWHGLIVDITERMRDEAEIKLKNEELINLNATKDKFFSIIAHDLKSPFNSIIGFSNLLIRQIEEKDYASIEKYAGIIQNSSQQAMDLLMNLLEWSRSQTGRIVYTPEKIDISTSINKAAELFLALAQQKSITIYLETSANLSFFADKAMINTILRNLISNAIKFTNVGGEISISAKQMLNDLVVSVSDNGVGMDEKSISMLFRIDQNHTTLGTNEEKGTGLGLLLCKEFVEKHGGKIWVESFPGKGSKFHFSIPNSILVNSSSN